jgi:4-amino-4-deoxy-L-arabinose transferase-like glycosyltransferase
MNYHPRRIGRSFDNLISARGICLVSFLTLALVCYLAFFYRLSDFPLLDPDEGRSGAIAKEILVSGNWGTLKHNGMPYYDKPALYFSIVALGLMFLGINELAVRLPSALAASLIVAIVYLWGTASEGWKRGLWGGLILSTSLFFLVLSRFGRVDMLFSLFLCAALFYFLWWQRSIHMPHGKTQENDPQDSSKAWIWPFYVLIAFAVLTKGPVGVLLPLLIVSLAIALKKRWWVFREMRLLWGLTLVVLVAGPWYFWAAYHDPEYIRTFLWDHNILRFFTSTPGIGRLQPVYYFVPILLAGFLPWSFFLPAVVHDLWERRGNEKREDRLFLLVWVVTILIFFSLSRNKLGTYILPAFPPLALLTGDFIRQFMKGEETRLWRKRWILYTAFIWLAFPLLLSPLGAIILKHFYPKVLPLGLPILPFTVLILLASIAWVLRKERWIPCIVSSSSLLLVLWFYEAKGAEFLELRSTRSLVSTLNNSTIISPYRIVAARADSLAFYLGRKINMVPSYSFVEAKLRESFPTIAVVTRRRLPSLKRIPSPRLFIWTDSQSSYALVANFPRLAVP